MTMTMTVFGGEGEATIEATIEGDRVLVTPAGLTEAIGWTLRPEGLCRDDVCVPVRDRSSIEDGDRVDLVAAVGFLGSPTMVAAEEGLVAIGVPASRRSEALTGRIAPDFELPDLDGTPHRLSEWDGRRRLLVAFATW